MFRTRRRSTGIKQFSHQFEMFENLTFGFSDLLYHVCCSPPHKTFFSFFCTLSSLPQPENQWLPLPPSKPSSFWSKRTAHSTTCLGGWSPSTLKSTASPEPSPTPSPPPIQIPPSSTSLTTLATWTQTQATPLRPSTSKSSVAHGPRTPQPRRSLSVRRWMALLSKRRPRRRGCRRRWWRGSNRRRCRCSVSWWQSLGFVTGGSRRCRRRRSRIGCTCTQRRRMEQPAIIRKCWLRGTLRRPYSNPWRRVASLLVFTINTLLPHSSTGNPNTTLSVLRQFYEYPFAFSHFYCDFNFYKY